MPGLVWLNGNFEGYDTSDFGKPPRAGVDVLAEAVIQRLRNLATQPRVKHL